MKKLVYVSETDRFGVYDCTKKKVEWQLHCGDVVEVKIDGKFVKRSIEFHDVWFLVDTNLSDMELQGLEIK